MVRRLTGEATVLWVVLTAFAAAAYGTTPPTLAPWVYIGEGMYRSEYPRIDEELPRVEDLQPPYSAQEQRQVVEGAVQTVGNAAEEVVDTAEVASDAVAPPPPPRDIVAGAGALLVNTAKAVAGAFKAVFGVLF
jgi:hypothetical protein